MTSRRAYDKMLISRGLCIACCDLNDTPHRMRCSACSRRVYVRMRIPVVMRYMEQYRGELRRLLDEDMAWKRGKHGKHASRQHLAPRPAVNTRKSLEVRRAEGRRAA